MSKRSSQQPEFQSEQVNSSEKKPFSPKKPFFPGRSKKTGREREILRKIGVGLNFRSEQDWFFDPETSINRKKRVKGVGKTSWLTYRSFIFCQLTWEGLWEKSTRVVKFSQRNWKKKVLPSGVVLLPPLKLQFQIFIKPSSTLFLYSQEINRFSSTNPEQDWNPSISVPA